MTPAQRKARIEKNRINGKKGGLATRKKHGKDHYKKIGSKGGKASWKMES